MSGEDEALFFLMPDPFSEGDERDYRDSDGAPHMSSAARPLFEGRPGGTIGTAERPPSLRLRRAGGRGGAPQRESPAGHGAGWGLRGFGVRRSAAGACAGTAGERG